MRSDRPFKFAVTGGAAGTFLPAAQLDVPLDFAAWQQGVAVGSGSVVVADDSISAVEMLLWILRFFAAESCGKCTPCRIGTVQASDVVQRIVDGAGKSGDLDALSRLASLLDRTSFCGLGRSVAEPIRSSLRYFEADFRKLGAK